MADLHVGGHVDPATHQRLDTATAVGSADLTTHGVIVGMTGSGKTGLGVVLIEECLSAGIPALLIDPKGDLTNLCLTFPALAPADFEPWVNESDAAKAGLGVPEFAAQQATAWREGLAGWGIGPERIAALRQTVDFTIYTPGSTAGVPLNIVGSLAAPRGTTDAEILRDEIDGYVTSLLAMLGVDADPISSREHILLATLIESAWTQGRDLDLGTLLAQVQQPPLRKLGVLELDQFFPPSDRMAFALRLNGLLAAPSFATWMSGDPVDVGALLRTADGRPRCAIVTTAHLSDEERQSVTALVLGKVVTWMRRQSGTSDLRALLYMDEVAGYLPPTANPPTKKPIMLLLKQARAFGLGVVLSTQNPVDVDYKALSNAGTWMVGRLQTERDKARLVDGLASAAGTVDVGLVGDTISGLGKREFLLRRAGTDTPEVFTTRWAMSYLRGPLTRDQIARLKSPVAPATDSAPVPADVPAPPPPALAPSVVAGADETPVAPAVADGTLVAYLDPAAPWGPTVGAVPGSHLRPAAVARVHLRYDDTKADLVHDEEYEAVLFPLPQLPDPSGFVPVDYDERDLLAAPPPSAVYGLTSADVAAKTWWTTLRRALADHLVRTRTLDILVNRELGLYSRVGESRAAFVVRCTADADARADRATAALRGTYEAKLATLRSRLQTAEAAVRDKEAARSAAYQDTAITAVGSMLGGLFGGRRSRASVTTAARRVRTTGARVDAARDRAGTLADGVEDLEAQLAAEVADLDATWMAKAQQVQVVPIPLEKTDVSVVDLRLVWVPVG